MFSVYGVTGQSFRGSLEKLIAVPGLSAARRSRSIDQEGEELGPEMRVFRRDNHEDGQYQKAAQVYRQMLRVSSERTPVLHAYPLMSRDVMTLRPDTRVEDAWRQLVARGLGLAPVLDKNAAAGRPGFGSGLAHGHQCGRRQGARYSVAQRCRRDDLPGGQRRSDHRDIRRVARVLLDYQLSGLPVVNEREELVGILSRSDILRALVNDPPLSLWA
jgi:CBS domain-containing protein